MNILERLTDNWNYEIGYIDGDTLKIYRCNANDALHATDKLKSHLGKLPDEFQVEKRT